MTTPLLSNFGKALLQEPIASGDTELRIPIEHFLLFPQPGPNEYFAVTLFDSVQEPEIVHVLNNNAGVFTVLRGQEGTSAKGWDAYTQVRHGVTAGTWEFFRNTVQAFRGTSASVHQVETGSKLFLTQPDKVFEPGTYVIIRSAAAPTANWMAGWVEAYTGEDLTVQVNRAAGGGEFDDWIITVSGPVGETGDDGGPGLPGPPGNDGLDGNNGEDGKTILNGTGSPSSGLGTDGDFYLDLTSLDFYGPKAAGNWPSPTNLLGDAANLLTTRGDLLVRGVSTVVALALGAQYQSLLSDGDDAVWGPIPLSQGAATTGELPVNRGGTGAADAPGARTNLGAAPLASPAFTGNPTAPTQDTADNSTRLATTAWVKLVVAALGGGDMLGSNNLSDVASASASRSNLGLGGLAVKTNITRSGEFALNIQSPQNKLYRLWNRTAKSLIRVTAYTTAGTCTIVLRDNNGNIGSTTINVTTSVQNQTFTHSLAVARELGIFVSNINNVTDLVVTVEYTEQLS